MQWSQDELDAYAAVLQEPERARASSACYRTFLTREMLASQRGRYHPSDLQVPSLLVMGGASFLTRLFEPQSGGRLRVEVIPGAGHFLPEEAPDAVLELAVPFLASPYQTSETP